MKNKQHPESLMMSYGYKPELSEGAIKSPIFQTSTFVFKSAEDGKAFFEIQNKKRKKGKNENVGLIYSRMNNPNMEILENRLTLWDDAEDCCVFESGMAAITTLLLEFLKPGDLLVYSIPLYGGTEHFIDSYLKDTGVHFVAFKPTHSEKEIIEIINATGKADKFSLMFIETPSNPTSTLIDISMCKKITDKFSTKNKKVYLACDNTYLGPLWQHPLKHGADFSLYSATKYIGGHSDLIAGACLGNKELMSRIRSLRSQLGNMAGPWTCWLMMRSLETLKIRMEQQAANAKQIVKYLSTHPKIEKIYFPGMLKPGTREYKIFKKQSSSAGAMVSFDVKGGEKEAFRFLNSLKLVKLAVSLGSTESLAEHPETMTHAGVSAEHKKEMAISEKLIRFSVGLENADDIIEDLKMALEKV